MVASRSGTHCVCLYDDRDVVCVAAGSWRHSRFCVSSISPALSEIRPIVSIWTRSHRSSLGCRLRDVRTLGDCSVRLLTLQCISTRVDLVFYWEKKVFLEFLNVSSSWWNLFLAIQLVFKGLATFLKKCTLHLHISFTLAVVDEHVCAHSLCSFFLVSIQQNSQINLISYLIL